ncbi:Rid family hydrolase [Rhodococcoides kyotonense]|uniref:Endoribonuclease L-PSP n=1 Tax=Rhodococcoides kyotonense TaxID=398843 RepID=A0A239NDH0_9NOCA|nr:Rid family hydrolase [Rhodococcus kyotonensis]SNT52543.1 Endoribonuclease L-PSP [Rhodococcus kyotonensis]
MQNPTRSFAAALAAGALLFTAACSSDSDAAAVTEPTSGARAVIEPGESNPMIAQGVEISGDATVYKSSGIGPTAMNDEAPEGSPESYIDTDQFSGGTLPDGVTVTEAQGIGVLKKIRDNLEDQGYSLEDVVTMRVFLDNAPGTDRADYTGWNRAYRQFFANTNLDTEETELVPMGTAEPAAPIERNSARPSRFALEVATLPVQGWLVEVEVDAVK